MSDSRLIIMVFLVAIMICFIADNRKWADKRRATAALWDGVLEVMRTQLASLVGVN